MDSPNPLVLVHAWVIYSSCHSDWGLLKRTKEKLTALLVDYWESTIYYSWRSEKSDQKFIENFLSSSECIHISPVKEAIKKVLAPTITSAWSFLQASIIKCLLRKKRVKEIDIAWFYYTACVQSHTHYLSTSLCNIPIETIEFISNKVGLSVDQCKQALKENISVNILKEYCRSADGKPWT